jgi:hypothetical protein
MRKFVIVGALVAVGVVLARRVYRREMPKFPVP